MKPFSFFGLCSPCSVNDEDHKQRIQPANRALTSIHYQQEVMKLQSQSELNNNKRKLGSLCISLTEKQFDQTKYDQKFSCKTDIEQKQVLSRMIAKYIGKRVQKYENIIEVNSSINQYSIEFARNGSFVIAISNDYTTIQIGQDNILINKYINQIQQIYGRFLEIKLIGVFDLIFINLTDELDITNEILLNQLIKAFKMSQNIIVFTTNEIYEAQIFNIINYIFQIDSNIIQHTEIEQEKLYLNKQHRYNFILQKSYFSYTLYHFGIHINQHKITDSLLEASIQKQSQQQLAYCKYILINNNIIAYQSNIFPES